MDSSRQVIAKYRYDAWGKLISMTDASGAALGENTIGARNPLRYRGYIYDSETGFYYLQSRYYDPVVHRFISPEPNVYDGEFDDGSEFLRYNVYVYCVNNPVNNFDPTGEFFISTTVLIGIGIGALVGGIIGGTYGYNKAVKNDVPEGQRWKYAVGYGLGGAVVGGVIGGFIGYGVSIALGAHASKVAAMEAISKAILAVDEKRIEHIMNEKHAWENIVQDASWDNVKWVVSNTIMKGATTQINVVDGVPVYEAVRNNVVVRYAIRDGIIRISDAWFKTR